MTDLLTTAETLWGNLKVDPVPYTLIAEKAGSWWYRKTVYKIRSPYSTISGFKNRDEAVTAMMLMRGSHHEP